MGRMGKRVKDGGEFVEVGGGGKWGGGGKDGGEVDGDDELGWGVRGYGDGGGEGGEVKDVSRGRKRDERRLGK